MQNLREEGIGDRPGKFVSGFSLLSLSAMKKEQHKYSWDILKLLSHYSLK